MRCTCHARCFCHAHSLSVSVTIRPGTEQPAAGHGERRCGVIIEERMYWLYCHQKCTRRLQAQHGPRSQQDASRQPDCKIARC
jgi:hypothetical protein